MARATTTTIRVSTETRDRVASISTLTGASAGDLIGRWAAAADDELLLERAAQSWEAMDDDALARYRAEADELDAFAGDLPEY